MIGQVTNIAGADLQILKPADAGSSVKALPVKNSIVAITVLDKSGSSVKLLVEGSVFLAKLPVSLQTGESLLARVMNLQPFTLSLDSLLQLKNINEGAIAALLGKLQLPESAVSSKVLKAFLASGRPVPKSKLQKLIDLIENEGLQLDDRQMAFLVHVVSTGGEAAYQSLNESSIHIFTNSASSLQEKILSTVEDLHKSSLSGEDIESIESLLTYDISEGSFPGAKELKEAELNTARCIDLIEEMKKRVYSSGSLSLLTELQTGLTEYVIFKSYSASAGIIPGFMILKSEEGMELLSYRFDKAENTYRIDLNMQPDLLGAVSLSGFMNDSSLNATFNSGSKAAELMESEKESLTLRLKESPGIISRLSFNSASVNAQTPSEMRTVNVRV